MKIVIGLIICSFISSCALFRAPRKIRKEFNYEFKSGERQISQIYRNRYKDNKYDTYYLFFEDETFCGLSEAILRNFKGISIQELQKRACSGELNEFFRFGAWGCYEIKNDTIHLKYLEQRISGSLNWAASSSKLVFKNRDTMQMISKAYFYPTYYDTHDQLDLVLMDTCSCKVTDSWLKYEKWFWKNEQDYLEWIEKSGGNKKKYK